MNSEELQSYIKVARLLAERVNKIDKVLSDFNILLDELPSNMGFVMKSNLSIYSSSSHIGGATLYARICTYRNNNVLLDGQKLCLRNAISEKFNESPFVIGDYMVTHKMSEEVEFTFDSKQIKL